MKLEAAMIWKVVLLGSGRTEILLSDLHLNNEKNLIHILEVPKITRTWII